VKNCYQLNIDISNALKEDIVSSRVGKYRVENVTHGFDKIFNKEWFDQLTATVGRIKNVLIFSRPAHWSTGVSHVDLKNDKTPVWFSLNWILTGKDSEMVWHNPPENYLNSDNIKTTMSNNYNLQWKVEDLEVIEKYKVTDKLVIARTDIPHSIVVKSEPRIAIAIRPALSIDPSSSWHDAVEFYKRNNLIVEGV
jgi:hypothetical protein